MSLKTFVKIGKITNLSDARYCAGMMVDILGFNLEEGTAGYVSPEDFKEITDWVAGVKFAGEFENAQAAEVKLASQKYALDYIEVQTPEQLEELQDLGADLIYKLTIHDKADLDQLESKLDYASDLVAFVIIDCLELSLVEELQQILTKSEAEVKFIRSYGLSQMTASSVADDDLFHGIELEGSPEDRPGFKDYGNVMDILEVLEED